MKKNNPKKNLLSSQNSTTAASTSVKVLKRKPKLIGSQNFNHVDVISSITSDFVFSVLINKDKSQELEWITDNFSKSMGYSFKNLLKQKSWKKYFPEEDQKTISEINRSINNNKNITAEFRILKKDGTILWHQGVFNPIFDKRQKRVIRYYGLTKDITEEKRIKEELHNLNIELEQRIEEKTSLLENAIASLKEEIIVRSDAEQKAKESEFELTKLSNNLDKKLRESEYHHLWSVFEHSEIAVATLTTKGKCLNYNKAAEKLFGFTHKELPDMDSFLNKLIPNDLYRARIKSITQKTLLAQFDVQSFELIVVTKSGEKKHITLQATNIRHNGAPTGNVIGFFNDVTEVKNSEIKLQAALDKYKVLFNLFPLGVSVSDKEGKIVEVNDLAQSILGVSKAEHKNRTIASNLWRIVRTDMTEMPTEEFASVKALNEKVLIKDVKMGVIKENNEPTWISVSAAPLPNSTGGGVVIAYGDITETVNAKKALEESEERYKSLVNSSPFSFLVHRDGEVLFVNEAFLKMFKVSDSSQIIGKNILHFLHPESLKVAQERIKKIKEENLSAPKVILKINTPDGSLLDIESHAIPIMYNGEKAILNIINDITDQNKIKKKLVATENQVSKLIETIPVIVFSTDSSGVYTLSEGTFLKSFALKPGELVGQSVFELYKDQPNVIKFYNDALKGKEVKERLIYEDVAMDIFITPIIDDNGKVISLSGIAYDITKQIIHEKELFNAAKEWQTTFDSVSDAVWVVDLNSTIIRANKASVKLFNLKIEDMVGKKCYEIVHNTSGPILECPVQRMKITGSREIMQYNIGEKYFDITADPIFDKNGKLAGAVHSIRDITERFEYEEKLKLSEAKYKLISENSSDLIWILELQTMEFIYSSPSVQKIRGFSQEEVRNQQLKDMISPESLSYVEELLPFAISEIIKGNHDYITLTLEVELLHKNGKQIPVEIAATFILNEEGIPIQVVGVTRDISERKEAQKRLQDSEERYRNLIELSPDAVYVHHQGKFLFANKATLKLLGVESFDELKGKNVTDFLHPDSVQLYYERWTQILKDKTKLPYVDFKFIRKDGTVAYVESIASTIEYNGSIAIQSVARDITERKESERALRESQERFKIVVEHSPTAIVIHQNGKLVYANPTAVKIIGAATLDDILYKNILDFVHKDYKTFAQERIKHAAQSMQPLPAAEEKIVRLDGKVLEVEVTSVPFFLNNSIAFQLIIRDISEIKVKTEQLRKLSLALEQNSVAVIITDYFGTIEYANPKLLEITGYEQNEVIGKTPRIFNSGKQPKEFYTNLWQTILSGGEWRGEFQNKKKNGELFWDFSSITPIKNTEGKITHFVAIKDDITAEKKHDEEMLLVKDEAENAYKVKTSLLANMSHELRTPLNGIIGFSQLLLDYVEEPDARSMVEKIIRSGNRLSSTFTEILSLSELEMGDVEINYSPLDLTILCEELNLRYCDKAEAKFLTFQTESTFDSLGTFTDESWLQKILLHLIDNAIKFTDTGSVTIQLNQTSVKDGIEYAQLAIIDTGIGISKDEQKTLFKEFRQLSEGTQRNFEGLGLGLSLAKRIAQHLNCLITVESEIGKGSTFTLHIPILKEIPVPKELPEPFIINKIDNTPQISGRDALKILLVEDNVLNIEVVSRFLSKTGEITAVRDGETALKTVQSQLFDLLLVDISLGHGIDGIEVLKQIRLMKEYKNVPAIALTGYISETNKRRFKAVGFNGLLTKPFEKKDLLNYISKFYKL